MSLEPCKVCGTLNAAETEICLSCGYPTQGNKRPAIFRWVAIALIICFALPFVSGLLNWVMFKLKPESPEREPSKVSLLQASSDGATNFPRNQPASTVISINTSNKM